MKIFITGGSGFVGTTLSQYLTEKGIAVVATGTSSRHPLQGADHFEYISADTTHKGEWQKRIPDADVVINLAGRNIFHYWTESYKKQIYDSRIMTTRHVVDAMKDNRPALLISTSAMGYYGDRGDDVLNEGQPPGNDFLAQVCVDWEREAMQARDKGARVVLMRFGVILGHGGALAKMIPAFKFFVGGPLGSGAHWFSWMHMNDLAAAVDFVIDNRDMEGPCNFCSPHPVRNRRFARILGQCLNRPSFFRAPAFALRMFMGEMGAAMLSSQRGRPGGLETSGFTFQYPGLEKALSSIIK